MGNGFAGNTNDNTIVIDIFRNHAVCPNRNVVPNSYFSDNFTARPQIDIIPDYGVSGIFAAICGPNGYQLVNVAIGANNHIVVNDDSAEVTNIKTGPDISIVRDVDTKFEFIMAQA